MGYTWCHAYISPFSYNTECSKALNRFEKRDIEGKGLLKTRQKISVYRQISFIGYLAVEKARQESLDRLECK